jgi:glycosyltransferase involved in cell wall biosynthesis
MVRCLNSLQIGGLKITMLSSEYPPCWGGVGTHVQNLCRQLCHHVNMRLVTATYREPHESFTVNNLAKIRAESFPFLLAQYLGGLRVLNYDKSDLIHVHVPHAITPKRKSAVVSTFHVVWAGYLEALKHQHPISIFDLQIPPVNERIIKKERQLALSSDAVIAVSNSVKKELVTCYGVPEKRIAVIPNGVDVDLFTPSDKREKVVLYMGRHTAHKGLTYLLQAFAEFVRANKDYVLIMIGERLEGGIDPSLVKLSKNLGLANKVKFTGRLQEAEARLRIGRAACLVLPSLAESFGMTCLEAMASETPVVATNVGGIPDVVSDNVNGLLVQPADPHALAESIQRVVFNSRLRRRLVENGKKTCQNFSWRSIAQETLKVYNQVCS